jgi:lipid A ethanolaminephosphotransferase
MTTAQTIDTRAQGLRPEWVAGLLAVYTALVLNVPFWREILVVMRFKTIGDSAFVAALLVLVVAWLWCLFGALLWPRIFKPLAIVLLFIAASASYHTAEFGTLYDHHMMANILQTDRREARDLLTWPLALTVGLLAGLPAILLAACPINYRPFGAELRAKVIGAAMLVVTTLVVLGSFTSHFIPMVRENVKLRYMLAPLNVIAGIIGHLKPSGVLAARARPIEPLMGAKSAAWRTRSARSLTVIVVGETARAGNFSLNGYPRATNPALSAIDGVVSFKQVESCGTATAQSLPCMFSNFGYDQFTTAKAAARENLADVLQRAGFTMVWRDNQSGCKGICLRIPHEQTNISPKAPFNEIDTLDDVLLNGLETWIDRVTGDGVAILHMMGSHGPAYYKRYDPAAAPFAPTCETVQFSACSREALINTYDNTIHFTDRVLGQLIAMLQAADARGTATAMLYVSDHGESLGERGAYLHGLPMALAPKEQTHIPWITWLSPRFRRDNRVDMACLARAAGRPLSHDNLFHSVLGLLDVESPAYRRPLDAYDICRRSGD